MKYLDHDEIVSTITNKDYSVHFGQVTHRDSEWLHIQIYVTSTWFDVITKCEVTIANLDSLLNELELLVNLKKQQIEFATEYGSFLMKFEFVKTGSCIISGRIGKNQQEEQALNFRFPCSLGAITDFIASMRLFLSSNS